MTDATSSPTTSSPTTSTTSPCSLSPIAGPRPAPGPRASIVAEAPAPSDEALAHFSSLLRHETDCWDVHTALGEGSADFVVLDVRGRGGWEAGHVAGAVHLPHGEIDEARLAHHPTDTVFVVYCAGPHCNGADRAAVRLAGLGRPVKKMIGGVQGWLDEGFDLVH